MEGNDSADSAISKGPLKRYYAFMKYKKELSVVKSNFPPLHAVELQNVFSQRLEKGLMHAEVGSIKHVELSSEEGEDQILSCYYYAVDIEDSSSSEDDTKIKYIICFLLEQELTLELYRGDLEKYCCEIMKPIKDKTIHIASSDDLTQSFLQSMVDWYTVAVEFVTRTKQILGDNLKYLIYSALHDDTLTITGGTDQQQNDIRRFYDTCGLSSILSQLRETRYKQETGSISSSVDMLADVDNQLSDTHDSINLNILSDEVKVDSDRCNKFCEEWANAMNRPEFDGNPTKQKQVVEAFKLKFIHTMNTLKRLLREAENDFYALYRSFVFLRDSGNSEILLHFVTTEGAIDTADVLCVLKDFLKEEKVC
ncbi:hypothetical protein ACF0H5_000540 [Mactra antiquata]